MFSASVVAIFFVGMFLAIFLSEYFENRALPTIAAYAMTLCSLCALYCLVAAVALAIGWESPLSNAAPEQIVQDAATHGGRGGLFILVIRFWPFVLGAISGYVGFYSTQIAWRQLKK